MDTERAEGIVLRRQPVTESSLLVTWYTREFGKLKTLAKGARRVKGPFQGKIDLFYRDEIVFGRFGGVGVGLLRVAAAGGTPMPLTKLDVSRQEIAHLWPQFLPDGRHLIFLSLRRPARARRCQNLTPDGVVRR